MKQLQVGIVGFGMIGKVHAFGYRALPFYSRGLALKPRIAMVAAAHAETAESAASLLECRGTTDYREITENPEIDIVHICTPNREHIGPLLSAIAHQKCIYCDKPLTASLDEAVRVESALHETDSEGKRRYGKTNQMTFHLRFIPALRRAKQLIGEGRLGRLFQYRAVYMHSGSASPLTPFKWKFDEGGGVIRDLGAHLADLVDWLIGLPGELIADADTAFPRRPDPASPGVFREVRVEDAFTMMTRHRAADGLVCRGLIEATKLAPGCEDEMFLEIYGEKGSLRFSLMDSHYLDFFDATRSDRPFGGESGWTRIAAGARSESPLTDFPSPKSTAGWIRAHIASLVHFLDAVGGQRSAEPDLYQGIRVQRFLDRVESSVRSKQWVSF